MTEAWKRSVDRRLLELGKTRLWLAEQLKTGKSTVTQMLGERQTASVHVDATSELLKIEPPFGIPDPLVEEAVGILRVLTDEGKQKALEVLRVYRDALTKPSR